MPAGADVIVNIKFSCTKSIIKLLQTVASTHKHAQQHTGTDARLPDPRILIKFSTLHMSTHFSQAIIVVAKTVGGSMFH